MLLSLVNKQHYRSRLSGITQTSTPLPLGFYHRDSRRRRSVHPSRIESRHGPHHGVNNASRMIRKVVILECGHCVHRYVCAKV